MMVTADLTKLVDVDAPFASIGLTRLVVRLSR